MPSVRTDQSAYGRAPVLSSSTVDDIIATGELFTRTRRLPNYKAENDALTRLVEVMSETPDIILQALADTAMALCEAGSAGISIAEVDGDNEIFRWHATSGHYTEYLGGTMPRYFSPCGTVLDRNAPLLMIDMVKYYDYVSQLNRPPREVLLVPFHKDGKAIGTVWVVAHDDSRQFDAEDLRILRSLTHFASVAVQVFARTRELEKANALAQATGETREQFIAVLGHDLRNPLGAIVNSAKLLERGIGAEKVGPLGQIIGKSAYRIGELVDNLLDFARGRLGGGIGLSVETHHTLEPILSHVVAELRSGYPGRHVRTSYAIKAPVQVDANRIAQMVSNLIGNALTHGASDTAVELSAYGDDGALTISVRNTGAPIPPDIMTHLFKPFERGTSDSNKTGLGLGLFIAAEIAHAHGGALTVTSTDEATVFSFVLTSSSM